MKTKKVINQIIKAILVVGVILVSENYEDTKDFSHKIKAFYSQNIFCILHTYSILNFLFIIILNFIFYLEIYFCNQNK